MGSETKPVQISDTCDCPYGYCFGRTPCRRDDTHRTVQVSPAAPPAKSTNPKKAFGMAKPPLHLVPASAIAATAMAMRDGARKYGPFNWRHNPVDTSTYVAAAKRHLDLFWNGQDLVSDSPYDAENLAAVMACCAILIDAKVQGTLIDDRPPAQDLEGYFDRYTDGKGLPKP